MDHEYIIHYSIIKHEFWFFGFWIHPLLDVNVNKCKYKDDTKLDRYKARLVVEGFIQVERIDYNETLFLVVKINSLQVLLILATIHDYHAHQLDVQNTFLYMVM